MENSHLQTPEYKVSVILLQVLEKLKEEPIASKLNSARAVAGNDQIRAMQYVLPIVMQVEMEVLKLHGFDDSREGIVKFTQSIKELETLHSDIRNLHDVLKSQYLPPVSIYLENDTSSSICD